MEAQLDPIPVRVVIVEQQSASGGCQVIFFSTSVQIRIVCRRGWVGALALCVVNEEQ